ncbi:hypothetical protein ACJRO7_016615 [Eucalyptus globulus]|uniref:Uncharacterized protein n=1 Tax=Eucalyptus globulus TaxID=34317 RepID=A0ABD3L8G7_EUCGL
MSENGERRGGSLKRVIRSGQNRLRQSGTTGHPSTRVLPAALASLFVGISLALMLVRSVTFVIGLVLMPWVVPLVSFFLRGGHGIRFVGVGCAPVASPWHDVADKVVSLSIMLKKK